MRHAASRSICSKIFRLPLEERALSAFELFLDGTSYRQAGSRSSDVTIVLQVLLLDELTTFLDGEDQKGVLEAVRNCVGGPDEVRMSSPSSMIKLSQHHALFSMLPRWSTAILAQSNTPNADACLKPAAGTETGQFCNGPLLLHAACQSKQLALRQLGHEHGICAGDCTVGHSPS